MREIKYRGKWDGRWDYATPDDSHWQQFWACAEKETIGEYTGLEDKNGRDIFEGDILNYPRHGSDVSREVGFLNGSFVLINQRGEFYAPIDTAGPISEVVGNVFENPELLK
jgi:uncharacterized phage protein (TIGR01671 family)